MSKVIKSLKECIDLAVNSKAFKNYEATFHVTIEDNIYKVESVYISYRSISCSGPNLPHAGYDVNNLGNGDTALLIDWEL